MTPPPAEQFAARVFLGPTLRAQPDRRLVNLVRDGYDAAFEEIVRRYRRPLDRFAAAIVGGRSEDVTQDAFSKALLALRGTETEIELRPWLYRIVRNTALNELRDGGPAVEQLPEGTPGGRSASAEAEARQELRDLMDRLQALPEPQRAALVMRELEGLSHEEIATALGVSGGAARQAIFRARAALRDGLGLLVPMPVLRMLAEHADDAARAGSAIAAGAGASTAGSAALGGIGGGALKVGMATVLIAGTVGAGAVIDHHRGGRPGPEAAEAAPLETARQGSRQASGGGGGWGGGGGGGSSSRSGRHEGNGGGADDGHRGGSRSSEGSGSLGDGDRSGSNSGSDTSGGRSGHSGDDDGGHGGSGDNSGPGSISGGHHGGGDDGSDDHGGSGSGSGDTGLDDHSGSSGSGSGSGDEGSHSGSDDGSSSGPGGGEVASEPVPITPETELEDGGGSGSEGSGSGDLSGGDTSGVEGIS
ncbi:MAG TPA: RNA polymerase sigma factor [Solirubrobacterales bacterium]|jgi:RNA polymerase sigma factor (sigma-70 family)|nr:RNA polymerase sigma factor [Solirubrobacterales bacterium]